MRNHAALLLSCSIFFVLGCSGKDEPKPEQLLAKVVDQSILDRVKAELVKLVDPAYSEGSDKGLLRLFLIKQPLLWEAFGKTEEVFPVTPTADATTFVKDGIVSGANDIDGTWSVGLNSWKTWFDDLAPGTSKVKPYSYWGIAKEPLDVEVRSINSRKYAIWRHYDAYSESWCVSYETFSEQANRFIEIGFWFQDPGNNIALVVMQDGTYELSDFGRSFIAQMELTFP